MLIKRLLEFAGIEPQRFLVKWVSSSEGQKFADTISELAAAIKALGPNRKYRDAL